MKTIIIFILCINNVFAQCSDLDVVLLVDYSETIHRKSREQFVIGATENFVKKNNGRTGIILFNDEQIILSELTSNKAKLLLSISLLKDKIAGGFTDIEKAIMTASNMLLEEQNNNRKFIILISDAWITRGSNEQKTLITIEQLRIVGINICGVLIKSDLSKDGFMNELTKGCYVESDYENLSNELAKINLCL